MVSTPAVSVVMLSRNNPEITLSATSIMEQLDSQDEFIIVDDHSQKEYKDGLRQLSGKLGILLLDSERRGNRSYNRNLGASHASRDVVLFVDGDMVLLAGGLSAIKNAFRTRSESAFVGHVHGVTYDEEAIALYSGMANYVAKAHTREGLEEIRDNPLFAEARLIAHDKSLKFKRYYWLNFFSAVCVIDRTVFNEVGCFDETYTSWGCEDIDLGYRISKMDHGIGFIDNLHSVHIPHYRNVVKAEASNWEGMMYAVEKYRCWEWEAVATFRNAIAAVASVDQVIRRMRLIPFPDMDEVANNSRVAIEAVSQFNPQGRILFWDREGSRFAYEQIGLALPQLRNMQVDTCYVSSNVFAYPPVMAAEVLREATRIAKGVCVVDSGDRTRVDWRPIVGDFNFSYRGRDDHYYHDMMEYSYEKHGDALWVAHHTP